MCRIIPYGLVLFILNKSSIWLYWFVLHWIATRVCFVGGWVGGLGMGCAGGALVNILPPLWNLQSKSSPGRKRWTKYSFITKQWGSWTISSLGLLEGWLHNWMAGRLYLNLESWIAAFIQIYNKSSQHITDIHLMFNKFLARFQFDSGLFSAGWILGGSA